MKQKNIILIFLSAILVSLILDVLIRLYYYSKFYLKFDSSEFNNIATPLISLLGFIGLIITIVISLSQVRLQVSGNYFNYYREYLNKIMAEKSGGVGFSNFELLEFPVYVVDKYSDLKQHSEYLQDLQKFRQGINVSSNGKPYDSILGDVRLFRAQLHILLLRYKNIISEINNHKSISQNHKDVLFKEFFDIQITKYTTGIRFMDNHSQEVRDNIYTSFSQFGKEQLPFFDTAFYELRNFVEADESLIKYLV